MNSLAALDTAGIVRLVFSLGMRFGNSRSHSADVDFVSGGWWLPDHFRATLDAETQRRGTAIANWMRSHPATVDALVVPNRARFFSTATQWGLASG